ncbi:MAG TPA: alkaline phosphatase family protein [Candidatus Angelobacter sp.]|nr:alkaline phosphatase family protein [Candidatus Angelobacter sp.]
MYKSKSTLLLLIISALAITSHAFGRDNEERRDIKHVLLISVDGMHALDLTNYVAAHPGSTLAQLSGRGITYTNASTPFVSDSFPGLAALITGGSPTTTGLWYDVSFNRKLSPPAQTTGTGIPGGANLCPGTVGAALGFDEGVDFDLTRLDAGGGINPAFLPRDPNNGCQAVFPHQYVRVNTIFNVAREAGLYTAWIDKHLSYEWVNGPSNHGANDFFGPEVNSAVVPLTTAPFDVPRCHTIPDPAHTDDWTKSALNITCYDEIKVNAILNQIDGFTHDRSKRAPAPAIFGMNFQAVSVGQKLKGAGYTDVLGTPSAALAGDLDFVDQSLGRMVSELKKNGLLDQTLIIVTAKHGQSPIDIQKRTAIDDSLPASTVGSAYAFDISDDASLIWLKDPSLAAGVVTNLSTPANQAALGIQEIFALQSLANKFNSPLHDERTPDILLKVNTGVIFTTGSKIAEHGGMNEDDVHVALLLSNPLLKSKQVNTPVLTQQVAPTILRTLRLDPDRLDSVRLEQVPVLPFFFSADEN